MTTINVAIAVAVAVVSGAAGFAVSQATTTATVITCDQPKPAARTGAEKQFFQPTQPNLNGYRNYP